MTEKCFEITNTTKSDYLQFCKMLNLNQSDIKSRTIFFKSVLSNKVLKDTSTNSIIIKGDK